MALKGLDVVKTTFGKAFDLLADGSAEASPILRPMPITPKVTNFAPTKFEPAIKKAAEKYNIDAELIRSIIDTESAWNPNARSGANAFGLMQLRPIAVRELKRQGLKINPKNPEQNIEGGAKLISGLLDKYGNTEEALTAYNAGHNRFQSVNKNKYLLPKEAQEYADKVTGKMMGME